MKPTWPPLAELSSALQKKRTLLLKTLMDSVDVCAATSTGDSKRRVNTKNRDWLNRLHLRKTSAQPPTMQRADKHGPKKIAREERTTTTTTTVWPSSKKLPSQEDTQHRTIHSGRKTLRFKCSQCTDNIQRTPKDLRKHYEQKHRGNPPVFSCHMCTFTTHEFSYLQVHLLSHKDTFSCCSICKDNVQRTWSEFSTHLTMVHTQNGKYACEVCQKFSTSDDKEFLEHVLLHNLGLDRKSAMATNYKCQYCGYEASQKLLIDKHIKANHGSVKNKDVNAFASDPKSKPRLTRSAVKEMCWLTQDCISLPGREFLDKYCNLTDAQTTLEDTQQFLMKLGKQNRTKALKNVLANVPQDMTLHPKAENGIMSNVFPDSSQDILTVKNKLSQNGASFAKRLKIMSEKEIESANTVDSCVGDKLANNASLNDCLQNQEIKLNSDILITESTEGPQMEENRENCRLKTHLNNEQIGKLEEPVQDGVITNDLKVEKKAGRRAIPKTKRKFTGGQKIKSKKADKAHLATALKLVLKKNPESSKQWVTQSPVSPSKCNLTMDGTTKMDTQEEQGTVHNKQDIPGATLGTTNMAEKEIETLQDGGNLEKDSGLVEMSEVVPDLDASDELKTPHNSAMEASPLAQPVINPQSETGRLTPSPVLPRTQEDLPTDSSLTSERSSTFHWTPIPKNLERNLHLTAINPNQPVKRPTAVQPVVVLNHPDADIPEVARIMEVVNRYKGEVHKVVLSKRTLNALSAIDGEVERPPVDTTQTNLGKNFVRERFLLKLKLRRLSRKKFEVVTAETSKSRNVENNVETFRCWFCGRAFENREVWLTHRQRHLMEWKSPKCENS